MMTVTVSGTLELSDLLTFAIGTCALITLWRPADEHRYHFSYPLVPIVLFSVATVWAWLFELIDWLGILAIIGMALSAFALRSSNTSPGGRFVAGLVLLIFSVAVFRGHLPGFNPVLLFDDLQLSSESRPFSLTLSYGYLVIGFMIVLSCNGLLRSRETWTRCMTLALPYIGATIAIVLLLQLLLGQIRFDPKLSMEIAIWAWANMFFFCFAEQALLRSLIQSRIQKWLSPYRVGPLSAVLLTAVVAAAVSFTGQWKTALVSGVAAAGIGWVYRRTMSIEMAIMAQFLLNMAHILLFTYPGPVTTGSA